jgi:hypothetical protein
MSKRLVAFLLIFGALLLLMFVGDPSPRPRYRLDPDSLEWMMRTRYSYRSRDRRTGIFFTPDTSLTIKNIPPGEYIVDLRAVNKDGLFSDPVRDTITIHGRRTDDKPFSALPPPSPNPSSGGVAVDFMAPRGERVVVDLYTVSGARVIRLYEGYATGSMQTVYWNGRNARGEPVASGIYFCRFLTEDHVYTQKILVVH